MRGDEAGGEEIDAPEGGIDRGIVLVDGGRSVERRGAIRQMFGQTLGQLPDPLDDALPDPLVAVEADAGQAGELGHGVCAQAVEGVQQAGAQPEGVERRLCGDAPEVDRQVAAAVAVLPASHSRRRKVDRLEAAEPGAAHLLRAVVAGAVVPGQRLGEEAGQGRADGGVEPLRVQGDLVLDEHGVAQPVAPSGQVPGRHFVQGHGRGEALRIHVPTRRPAQPQEGVQVPGGTRAHVLRGGVREREVEHHQRQRLVPAALGHADVVRLEVAVRDPLLLQPLHHVQQLVPEALQEVEREPAFLPDAVREGVRAAAVLGAGHRHEQGRVAGELHVPVDLDDVLVAQRAQHFAFAPDAVVEGGGEGDLEHAAAVRFVPDPQRDGGRPLAEAPLHAEAVGQPVAGAGIEGVHDAFRLRRPARGGSELPLRLREQLQELRDGVGAAGDLRVGRALHDHLQGLRDAVEGVGEPKAAAAEQAFVQGLHGGRGRMAGEEPVGDGPEREEVELLRGVSTLARLRREIDVLPIVAGEAERRAGRGAPGARGSRARGRDVLPAGPPVEDLEPGPRVVVPLRHQDLPRAQRPVAEAAFVRVLEGFGELAQEIEAGREVQLDGGDAIGAVAAVAGVAPDRARASARPAPVPSPAPALKIVVQTLGARIVLEDEGRPRLRVRALLHAQDAFVDDAVEKAVLPVGRTSPLRARGLGGSPRERVDAYPPLRSGHRDVFRLPVLVRVRLEQQLAQDVIRHPPLTLRGADPRLFHPPRDGPGERAVDPRRRPAEIEARAAAQDVGDGRMAAALRFHGQVHAGARPAFESAPHPHVRQEDHGFDIGPALPSQRLLRLQEPRQLLRLAVRQQEGAVHQGHLAPGFAPPRALIAGDGARPALDLDQIDLVERDDEQIDFVDAAVFGDELEVRPRPERLTVREAGLEIIEGLALPGVLGGGDLGPAGGVHSRRS